MKLTTYISASVFIFLSAVVIREHEAKVQATDVYADHQWQLKKIFTPEGKVLLLPNNTVTMELKEEDRTAGGQAGCNSYGSKINIADNTISFTNIFSTKISCEHQETEQLFLSALTKANRYEIRGNTLVLRQDKKLLMEWR
jgi:heat shock protein HslJ